MPEEKYIGIVEDTRPISEQKKNYDSREIDLGGVIRVSKEIALLNAQNYIFRNQWHKSSCVPSSICNALWNTEKVVLADEPWYSTRINKPQPGSQWWDIAEKALKAAYARKDCPEVDNEKDANAYQTPKGIDTTTHIQKSFIFIQNPSTTFKDMCTFVSSGIAVAWSFFSNSKEWSREIPIVIDKTLTIENASINHAICSVPNTVYLDPEDDMDTFIITDSAWFGKIHTRHIKQAFYDPRFKHGVFFSDLETPAPIPGITQYTYARDLSVGSRGEDVKALQINMRELGFLSSSINGIPYDPTTYFGGLTRQAVADYQKARKITPTKGYFGPVTRKRLMSEMQ